MLVLQMLSDVFQTALPLPTQQTLHADVTLVLFDGGVVLLVDVPSEAYL